MFFNISLHSFLSTLCNNKVTQIMMRLFNFPVTDYNEAQFTSSLLSEENNTNNIIYLLKINTVDSIVECYYIKTQFLKDYWCSRYHCNHSLYSPCKLPCPERMKKPGVAWHAIL